MVQYVESPDLMHGSPSVQPEWSPCIIRLHTIVQKLTTPYIPFAILQHDPVAAFQSQTRASHTQKANVASVQASWDKSLTLLPPEKQFFVMAWSSVPGVSTQLLHASSFMLGIASPGPLYKRWFTTRAVMYGAEPVAWSVEIDMRGMHNEMIDIVLAEENMLHLWQGSQQLACSGV